MLYIFFSMPANTASSFQSFFFFQAEDGIRDRNVTGVQTCALPISQLRGGADFCTLAAAYTERPVTNGQKPCKIGLFAVPDLRPDIAGAIKNVKVAGVSDPLKTDEGYQILKVDARNAGSNAAVFNENQVRGAMTEDRVGKER